MRLEWEAGESHAVLEARRRGAPQPLTKKVAAGHGGGAVQAVASALAELGIDLRTLGAVGHRIVHGGVDFRAPVRVDADVERRLEALKPLAPAHVPRELAALDAARAAFGPDVAQIAVFDTSFHRTLPPPAYTYPGPYEWLGRGIRRYGFHGINVAYCVERTGVVLGCDPASLRIAVAHLGNGASVTAVRGGESVDTSMGFTPLDGLMMGTRSGSVDPGISIYLQRDAAARGLGTAEAADEIDTVLNRQSGLLGLSGASSDVRAVLAAEASSDARARLALDVFVHRATVSLAGLLPSLGGLDVLVFTGGIGEHAAEIRERICAQLTFAGVALDAGANAAAAGERDLAHTASAVRVLALAAREEWFIARECVRFLARVNEM